MDRKKCMAITGGIGSGKSYVCQLLEQRGIKTIYSKETFLPHDADAYTRSRRTAEELLKKNV